MALFLDSSAVIKLVRTETGSDLVEEIARRPNRWGGAFVSDYVALEVNCRLAYFRRRQIFSRKAHRRARGIVDAHLRDTFIVRPAGPEDVSEAVRLASRFTRWDVGALDFLHLSAAKSLSAATDPDPVTIVASDGSLMILAERMGFDLFNPERDEISRLGPPQLQL